jgi:hypothetical protein
MKAFKMCNFLHGAEFLRLDRLVSHSHQRIVCAAESLPVFGLAERLESWEALRDLVISDSKSYDADEYHLRTRLGDLTSLIDTLGRAPDEIPSNYDFRVRSSWDCPLGYTARMEHARLSSAAPSECPWGAFSQHRSVQASSSYDALWHSRANEWIHFRTDASRVLCAAALGSNEPLAADNFLDFAQRLRGRLENLGLLVAAEQNAASSPLAELWRCTWLAVEATLALNDS